MWGRSRVGIAPEGRHPFVSDSAGAMPTRSDLSARQRGQNRGNVGASHPAARSDFAHPTRRRRGMTGRELGNVGAGAPVQFVDLVIAHIGWLITMDVSRRVIRDGAVAVDGGKIIAVGKSADITARYAGKSSVDGRNTVVTPGF